MRINIEWKGGGQMRYGQDCTSLFFVLSYLHFDSLFPTAPTDSPKNIQVSAEDTPGVVMVTWDEIPPESINGKLQAFLVNTLNPLILLLLFLNLGS